MLSNAIYLITRPLQLFSNYPNYIMKAVVFYSEHETSILRDFLQRSAFTLATYHCEIEATFNVDSFTPEPELLDVEIAFVLLSNNICEHGNWWQTSALNYMAEHIQGNITFIPVLVKPCNWQNEFSKAIEKVPFLGDPLTVSEDLEKSWEYILNDIGGILNNLNRGRLGNAA